MHSIARLKGEGAARYYTDVAQGRAESYYATGSAEGVWGGKLGRELGLAGDVDRDQFMALLLENKNPLTGQPLRETSVEDFGYDFTLSVPKSISVVHVLSDEATRETIEQAILDSAASAIGYLERHHAIVRRGHEGREGLRADGFITASYLHVLSRHGDPQLHVHTIIANASRGSDGRWTGLWGTPLWDSGMTARCIFHSELRARLAESLGLQFGPLVQDGRGRGTAEVRGVPEEAIREFSRAREAIEHRRDQARSTVTQNRLRLKYHPELPPERRAALEEELREAQAFTGHTAASMQALALKDRPPKRDTIGIDEQAWQAEVEQRAAGHGLLPRDVERMIGGPTLVQRLRGQTDREQAMDPSDWLAGPEGLTYRRNTFTYDDLLGALACQRQPQLTCADLEAAADAFLQRTDVHRCVDGRYTRVNTPIERWTVDDILRAEQKLTGACERGNGTMRPLAAAAEVDRFIASRPRLLGNDQSRALRELCASTNAVRMVEARQGTGKTTLAGAIKDLCDEHDITVIGVGPTGASVRALKAAGVTQAYTLDAIVLRLEHGASLNAVLVIVDEFSMVNTRDMAELAVACEREGARLWCFGDSYQLPSVEAGGWGLNVGERCGSSLLAETYRQRDRSERRAIGALYSDKPGLYLEWAQKHDRLHIADRTDSITGALDAWRAAVAEHGAEQAIMVTRSNALRADLNAQARELVREQLGEERCYGDVRVCVGEQIVCRQNDRNLDVDNGTRGRVATVSRNQITVEVPEHSGTRTVALPADYVRAHVEQAWCMTAHTTQSKTMERTLVIAEPAELTAEWSTTALTRARGRTDLYVADRGIDLDRADIGGQDAPRRPVDVDTLARAMSEHEADPRMATEQLLERQAVGVLAHRDIEDRAIAPGLDLGQERTLDDGRDLGRGL